jgi:hypothetical protein
VLALGGRRHDDPAATALHDGGSESADGVGRSGEVDVDGVVPVGVLQLEQRRERLDARVREQDVDTSQLAHHAIPRLTQAREVALIDDLGHPPPTRLLDRRARLIQVGPGRRRKGVSA